MVQPNIIMDHRMQYSILGAGCATVGQSVETDGSQNKNDCSNLGYFPSFWLFSFAMWGDGTASPGHSANFDFGTPPITTDNHHAVPLSIFSFSSSSSFSFSYD